MFFLLAFLMAQDPRVLEKQAERPGEKSQRVDFRSGLARIKVGMTQAEVKDLLGTPRRIARQALYRRYLEQWIYDDLPATWIEFNCVKGQEPHVITVHAPAVSRR